MGTRRKSRRDGVIRDGVIRDEMVRDGLTRDGVIRDDLVRDGLTRDGVIRNGGKQVLIVHHVGKSDHIAEFNLPFRRKLFGDDSLYGV